MWIHITLLPKIGTGRSGPDQTKNRVIPSMSDAKVSPKTVDSRAGVNARLGDTLKMFLSLMYQF
jgi:hypothetical protein